MVGAHGKICLVNKEIMKKLKTQLFFIIATLCISCFQYAQCSLQNDSTLQNSVSKTKQELQSIFLKISALGYISMQANLLANAQGASFPNLFRDIGDEVSYYTLSNNLFPEIITAQSNLQTNTQGSLLLLWREVGGEVFGLSIDPLSQKFPSASPYNAMGNDPINRIDPNGCADRKYNTKFSKEMLNKIVISINNGEGHRLAFLVEQQADGTYKWSSRKIMEQYKVAWQAGHLDALKTGAPERLAIQDADANWADGTYIEGARKNGKNLGITASYEAIEIDGCPVERNTAMMWERLGLLPPGTVENSVTHTGWVSKRAVVRSSIVKKISKKAANALPVVGLVISVLYPDEFFAETIQESVTWGLMGEIGIGPLDLQTGYQLGRSIKKSAAAWDRFNNSMNDPVRTFSGGDCKPIIDRSLPTIPQVEEQCPGN
jgi:hypothetical protein